MSRLNYAKSQSKAPVAPGGYGPRFNGTYPWLLEMGIYFLFLRACLRNRNEVICVFWFGRVRVKPLCEIAGTPPHLVACRLRRPLPPRQRQVVGGGGSRKRFLRGKPSVISSISGVATDCWESSTPSSAPGRARRRTNGRAPPPASSTVRPCAPIRTAARSAASPAVR